MRDAGDVDSSLAGVGLNVSATPCSSLEVLSRDEALRSNYSQNSRDTR